MIPFELADVLVVVLSAARRLLFVLVGGIVEPTRSVQIIVVRAAFRVRLLAVGGFGVSFQFALGVLLETNKQKIDFIVAQKHNATKTRTSIGLTVIVSAESSQVISES